MLQTKQTFDISTTSVGVFILFKRIEFISSVLNISRFLCHSRVQNILHDILVLVLIGPQL